MRDMVKRISLVLTVALATAGAQGQRPPGEAALIYPLVPGHGGIVPLPDAAEQPRKLLPIHPRHSPPTHR
jgi:hypothetical protein